MTLILRILQSTTVLLILTNASSSDLSKRIFKRNNDLEESIRSERELQEIAQSMINLSNNLHNYPLVASMPIQSTDQSLSEDSDGDYNP